jgi:hypothetical protein
MIAANDPEAVIQHCRAVWRLMAHIADGKSDGRKYHYDDDVLMAAKRGIRDRAATYGFRLGDPLLVEGEPVRVRGIGVEASA